MENKVERLKLLNMKWPYFLVFACIVWAAVQFVFLPKSLAGQISFLLVLGEALNFIGNRTPIVKDYLGGGSIVVLFGSSALVMFGLIPKEVVKETNTFITATFLNYALAALCCGSIFGMDRNILVKASLRYIPCILGGVIGAAVLSGLIGTVVMDSLEETLFFITLPIMGGGASAGAVPMSQMFAEILKKDAGTLLAIMTPAVALGNAFAIIAAGLLDKLGRVRPEWTGNGQIMRGDGQAVTESAKKEEPITDLSVFACGMAVAGIFLGLGQLIQSFVPSVHAYAWMILLMVIMKMIGIIPANIERCVRCGSNSSLKTLLIYYWRLLV